MKNEDILYYFALLCFSLNYYLIYRVIVQVTTALYLWFIILLIQFTVDLLISPSDIYLKPLLIMSMMQVLVKKCHGSSSN